MRLILAMGIGLMVMFVMGSEMLYFVAMGLGMLVMMLIMMHIMCPYIETMESWSEEKQARSVFYLAIFAIAMLVFCDPGSSIVAKQKRMTPVRQVI
jgi:hypothetical protein